MVFSEYILSFFSISLHIYVWECSLHDLPPFLPLRQFWSSHPPFFLILCFKTSSSLGSALSTGWLHSYHLALLIFLFFFFPLFCVLRLAPSLGVYSPRVASISLPLYLPNFALHSKNILPRNFFDCPTPNMIVSNSVKFDLAWCLLHLLLYSLCPKLGTLSKMFFLQFSFL